MSIKVFDFFSGCGGTSRGFRDAGLEIIFALDNDPDSEKTFKANFPTSTFWHKSIADVSTANIKPVIDSCDNSPLLFCGCAPCQPFSRQKTNKPDNDKRVFLLAEFGRFVKKYLPEYVFVENVPGMQTVDKSRSPLNAFMELLAKCNYKCDSRVVLSQDYGVPQRRRRLILIASKLGTIELPPITHGTTEGYIKYTTVREWIGELPPIEAGETHNTIPNHRAANLAEINLERIKATPEGGGRKDWPPNLRLRCHKNGYSGHTDVYGRMRWDEPATGLTTRCISLSNGRFGHPDQDRAISVREAACLQTFPRDFIFHGSLTSMARQIGNAVPPLLAKVLGLHFVDHFRKFGKGNTNGNL